MRQRTTHRMNLRGWTRVRGRAIAAFVSAIRTVILLRADFRHGFVVQQRQSFADEEE